MKSFRVNTPINEFYRERWYRFSLAEYEWTYYGHGHKLNCTVRVKLRQAPEGWIYSVHRRSNVDYVVVTGRPLPSPQRAVLAGMFWVEHHFANSTFPTTAAEDGPRVVWMDEWKERAAQRLAKAKRVDDSVPA